MLLNRFVFVLYLLLGYTWFLLGTYFDSDIRFVSIVSMMLTLVCMIIVCLLQLQLLLRRDPMRIHEKWSTIAWAVQHIVLCTIFCLEGLEWINVVVVMGLCGLLMTATIGVVGGCACFVIMQNGDDWHAHVHLTCITFWVMVQYMSLCFPSDGVFIVTSIPVILMGCIRLFEHVSVPQLLLWFACIFLHVLCDCGVLARPVFLWALATVVVCICSLYGRTMLTLAIIPLAFIPTVVFVLLRMCCGVEASKSVTEVVRLYNELTVRDLEPIVLPMDEEYAEEDWNETL